MEKESAERYLSRNRLLHIDMLESLRNGDADLLADFPAGVLTFHRAAQVYMMSAADEKTAGRMIENIGQAAAFIAHQEFYIGAAEKKFGLKRKNRCLQAAYLKKTPPNFRSEAEIRPLDESCLPFLKVHYSMVDGAYLLGRLRSQKMFGAFFGPRLAGFAGVHEEGSMGMLEVLPEYRRKGVALALESFLARKFLAAGRVPYAQIFTENTASLNLQRKFGMSLSKEAIGWLL